MRILLTGAGGFVGGHLVPALLAAHPGAVLLAPWFDVTDAGACEAAVAEARPDAVMHLAAVAAPADARRDPDLAWQVNLHGTLNLARAMRAAAPEAMLVFVGSADAYGASFRTGRAVDEGAPMAPLNTYGATKAAADLALGAMAAEGLRVIRFRPFNHTGPGQGDGFAVPAFARQVARIEAGLQPPVLEVGDLSPQRDFSDVRDICAAYARCLTAEWAPGTILNLASGQPRRIGDVLQDLLALAGVEAEVRADVTRMRPTDIALAVGDAAAVRRLLCWDPVVPWETTLADVLADWRKRVLASDPG